MRLLRSKLGGQGKKCTSRSISLCTASSFQMCTFPYRIQTHCNVIINKISKRLVCPFLKSNISSMMGWNCKFSLCYSCLEEQSCWQNFWAYWQCIVVKEGSGWYSLYRPGAKQTVLKCFFFFASVTVSQPIIFQKCRRSFFLTNVINLWWTPSLLYLLK